MTETPESGEDPLFHFLFLCPCFPDLLPQQHHGGRSGKVVSMADDNDEER